MKETYLHEIYDYLRNYKCDLEVEVKEGVKTLTKGNASTTDSNAGSIFINKMQFTEDNADNYTFYADYPEFTLSGAIGACTVLGGSKKKKRKPKNPIRKERQEQEQENIIKYFIK